MPATTVTGAQGRGGTAIHREVTYPHPRDKVWRAITDPSLIEKWLMRPEGFAPVVGTKFVLRAKTKQPGWRGYVECEVLEVVEGRTLVYSWVGDDDGPTLVVTFSLRDAPGGGTTLVLDHVGFEGLGGWLLARLMMGPGWGKMLSRRIPAVLASLA